ncbi:DUF1990 domain-containing protein [Nocardia sp. NPDC004568]|uniref:DUF1990 family protein n=1 Tax=Nocardia sp. NPDC004568 TaxID=3154551 RepID=UPI0033AF9394
MSESSGGPAFTYSELGATRGELPPGYRHLRVRRRIASGEDEFRRLGAAVLHYRIQRGLGILREAGTPVAEPGTAVTVLLGIGRFGLRAPCRVVYVLDEPDRMGFAYGTLPGHPMSGEELFAVEYDRATDVVYGVVSAFSRPATRFMRLGGPLAVPAQRAAAAAYLAVLRRTPRRR